MTGETCKQCGILVPYVANGPEDADLAEHECKSELEAALDMLHEHNMRVMEACMDIQASVRRIRALL